MTDVRPITAPDDLAAIDPLYRSVFGVADHDTGLNVRLLNALVTNSGHVIGAYDAGELVGFGLSFLARDEDTGRLYHYSQTVAVAAPAQVRGVGRLIKYAQRDAALTDGIDLIRWVFDPMYARNAHFNLDVLGGQVHRLHRNFYGSAAPGRDAGERTDRCLVDWELSTPPLPRPDPPDLALRPGQGCDLGNLVAVAVPADWESYRRRLSADEVTTLRTATIDLMTKALDRGLQAVSCRRVDDSLAVYLFAGRGEA